MMVLCPKIVLGCAGGSAGGGGGLAAVLLHFVVCSSLVPKPWFILMCGVHCGWSWDSGDCVVLAGQSSCMVEVLGIVLLHGGTLLCSCVKSGLCWGGVLLCCVGEIGGCLCKVVQVSVTHWLRLSQCFVVFGMIAGRWSCHCTLSKLHCGVGGWG